MAWKLPLRPRGPENWRSKSPPRAAVGAIAEQRVSVSCERAAGSCQSEAHVAGVDQVSRQTARLAPRVDGEATFVDVAGKNLEGKDDLLANGRYEARQADDTSCRGHIF